DSNGRLVEYATCAINDTTDSWFSQTHVYFIGKLQVQPLLSAAGVTNDQAVWGTDKTSDTQLFRNSTCTCPWPVRPASEI
ncbi:MAG: hypothetical protein DBP01_00560, partial [gamma proteobacterium symbiont of Ctena orbiculata]